MISTSDFHEGLIFEDGRDIYEVIKFQLHRMSQSKAVMRTKLRNMLTGAVMEKSYSSGEKFREILVEKRPKSYLYTEGDLCHFMDLESYEQVIISREKLGESFHFLKENMEVEGIYLDGKFLTVELPTSVALIVSSTVPGVKGDSVSNMTKPATLETGFEIKVPLFIGEGDEIRVDTRTGEYLERV